MDYFSVATVREVISISKITKSCAKEMFTSNLDLRTSKLFFELFKSQRYIKKFDKKWGN